MKKKGISLIVLIITIIVIIILAGVIILNLTKNNPINSAKKAKFLNDIDTFKSELSLYELGKMADANGDYDPKLLNSGTGGTTENGDPIDKDKVITHIITTMENTRYPEILEVIAGELVYIGNNEEESNWGDGVIESKDFKINVSVIPDVTSISGTVSLVGTLVDPNKLEYYKFYISTISGEHDDTPVLEIAEKSATVDFNLTDNILPNTKYYITVEVKMSKESGPRTREIEVVTQKDEIIPELVQIANPNYSNKLDVSPIVITLKDNQGGSGISKSNSKCIINNNSTKYGEEDDIWQTIGINLSEQDFIGDTATKLLNVPSDGEYYIHALGVDNAGNKKSAISGKIVVDTIVPNEAVIVVPQTATNNSIDASVTLSDNDGGSGLNLLECKYIYSSEPYPYGDTESIWNDATAFTSDTQTITVTSSTNDIYYLHVLLVDKAGNRREVLSSGITTNTTTPIAPVITGTVATNTWTNQNVTLTVNEVTSPGITKYEYTINGGAWQTYNSTNKILISNEGTSIIRARAVNNVGTVGADSVGYIVNIDKTAPSIPTVNFNGYTPNTWASGNVNVTLTSTDSASGILKYQYSVDNGTTWYDISGNWIINWNYWGNTIFRSVDKVGNASSNTTAYIIARDGTAPTYTSYNITNVTQTGYDIYVYGVTDALSGISRVQFPTWTDYNGQDDLQASWQTNSQATGQNLGNGTWYYRVNISDHNNESGQYQTHVWIYDNAGSANAFATTGAFIPGEYDSAQGLNRPKLATGMTPIKWDNNGNVVTTTASDPNWYDYTNKKWANAMTADGSMWVWIPKYEYKIPTPHSSTAQTILVNFIKASQKTPSSGYVLNFSGQGIWVGKFKASGTADANSTLSDAITVKPNLTPLKLSVDDAYITSGKMRKNSMYGWGTAGTEINTHMMSNTEWGMVAYLSQSIYGINSEVWINPTSTLTGQVGTYPTQQDGTTYSYNNLQYGGYASTTGNFYGVYDMGARPNFGEHVSAFLDTTDGGDYQVPNTLPRLYSDFMNSTYGRLGPINVYYDNRFKGDSEAIIKSTYDDLSQNAGDALWETSTNYKGSTSWYGNDSEIIRRSSGICFVRGGSRSSIGHPGIFSFVYSTATSLYGFRPIIAVLN